MVQPAVFVPPCAVPGTDRALVPASFLRGVVTRARGAIDGAQPQQSIYCQEGLTKNISHDLELLYGQPSAIY